jgi:hypothetical protein
MPSRLFFDQLEIFLYISPLSFRHGAKRLISCSYDYKKFRFIFIAVPSRLTFFRAFCFEFGLCYDKNVDRVSADTYMRHPSRA